MDAPDVVELVDATEIGTLLGFKCRISIYPKLATRLDTARMLGRFRDLLLEGATDPGLELMRGVALRGEHPPSLPHRNPEEMKQFVARVLAHRFGVSASGSMFALELDGEMLVCLLHITDGPRMCVIVSTLDGMAQAE